MLASPGFLESMEAMHPQLRAMLDAQPGMREMMRNPAFLQAMMSPQMLQMAAAMGGGGAGMGGGPFGGLGGAPGGGGMPDMGALMAALGGGAGGAPGGGAAPQPPAAGGMGGMGGLAALLGGMGGLGGGLGGGMGGAPAQPPEELYAPQLRQMEEMGLADRAQNIRALQAAGGNVNVAIERIFDGRS